MHSVNVLHLRGVHVHMRFVGLFVELFVALEVFHLESC